MGLTKRFGNYFIGIIAGVLLLAVSVFAIVMTGNIEYHGFFENADILMIILLIGGFIVQGATEEILCRGIVLHALKEKTPTWIAIAVSTVLFIIPHRSSLFEGGTIYGVIGVANLVLISIIFSLLTIRFKSIWAACGLHSFWNAILFLILAASIVLPFAFDRPYFVGLAPLIAFVEYGYQNNKMMIYVEKNLYTKEPTNL